MNTNQINAQQMDAHQTGTYQIPGIGPQPDRIPVKITVEPYVPITVETYMPVTVPCPASIIHGQTRDILKAQGKSEYYTPERFRALLAMLERGMAEDECLRECIEIDPYNKPVWIAERMVSYIDRRFLA